MLLHSDTIINTLFNYHSVIVTAQNHAFVFLQQAAPTAVAAAVAVVAPLIQAVYIQILPTSSSWHLVLVVFCSVPNVRGSLWLQLKHH
jgi:fructose-1,6-bisphosphatase